MATATERTRPAQNGTAAEGGLDAVLQETQKRRATITEACAEQLGVDSSKVCNLLRQVWKTSKGQQDLTDAEMFTGMSLIARYGLDPIAKEVYVTRAKDGRVFAILGIDGWIRVLDRNENYDGYDQEIQEDSKGVVTWIETRIYHKHRSHPTVYRAYRAEYEKVSGFVANQMPVHMLGLFSLRHAARRFAPIGGNVVMEEEFAAMDAATGDARAQSRPVRAVAASPISQQAASLPGRPEPDPEPEVTDYDAAYGVPEWAAGTGFGQALSEAADLDAVNNAVTTFANKYAQKDEQFAELSDCGAKRIEELAK